MTVPEAAIEAAAIKLAFGNATNEHHADVQKWWLDLPDMDRYVGQARAAIEAAMPAIREALAQEIEVSEDVLPRCQREAARIVRGGTP